MKDIINFLNDTNNFYLNNKNKQGIQTLDIEQLELEDVVLFQIQSITYEKDAPKRQALENVLSALRIEGINFIYLILGSEHGVNFYYGIARDYSKVAPNLSIKEIGEFILESSIKGNFRGSKISQVNKEEKNIILNKIKNTKNHSIIEGVPGILENEEEFQGLDRLVDIMGTSREFGLLIIASLLNLKELSGIEQNAIELYTQLTPFAKESKQSSQTKNWGRNESKSEGENWNKTNGENISYSSNESRSENKGINENISLNAGTNTSSSNSNTEGDRSSSKTTGESGGESDGITAGKGASYSQNTSISYSKSEGNNISNSKGTSISSTKGFTEGESEGLTKSTESINKQIQDWLKYIDEILLPRIDYAKGKGMFASSIFCFANSKAVLTKLSNTIISLFSGEKGNKIPLQSFLLDDGKRLQALKNLQLPKIKIAPYDEKMSTLLSRPYDKMASLISSKELSLIADLPKKEVIGLELNEEVEFGLNFTAPQIQNRLELGKLIQSGSQTNKSVSIDKTSLDKHIFITGVTGSGKTTTCQHILREANLPFLVIEPAKTEYRILKEEHEDLLIFTLGKDTIAPFRLNPFEFFKHESITSRVDMIKASIEAAFDMEAAIPQIIEAAIYECYKDKGWNIATNQNELYGNQAFDDGVYAFPTLSDLNKKVEKVVEDQGFDERLKRDYLGSIRARLQGLLVGAKGFMLDTKRSIDFRLLLDKKVVLELEEIRNGGEKSLVMGFIISNFLEAIKARFLNDEGKHGLKHIILIEEAHRLLSKYQAGDSLNKKQGVEVFADMLAEIRKYGECLIIADQIPNKLTPEVLKNTNTKIVHRIFAEDDKRAIGNTMALEKEQSEFLSKLETGLAIVFSSGFNKAVATKITQSTQTTGNFTLEETEITKSVYEFYAKYYKKGIILGSALLDKVNTNTIEDLLKLQRRGLFKAMKEHWEKEQKIAPKIKQSLEFCTQKFEFAFLVKYFLLENNLKEDKERLKLADEFLKEYLYGTLTGDKFVYFKNNLF